MRHKHALALLADAREWGLSLGPEPGPSDDWYEAWRQVLVAERGGEVALASDLDVPGSLYPWEREVLLPVLLRALAVAVAGTDLEVAGGEDEGA